MTGMVRTANTVATRQVSEVIGLNALSYRGGATPSLRCIHYNVLTRLYGLYWCYLNNQMGKDLQGLRDTLIQLAEKAAADGNELRLAAACEILRNGGADCLWPEDEFPEG